MKNKKYMAIVFFESAVYMILELVASRILAPYFGSSNIVWTSVIGIILLSSSVGNYIGGIIADKQDLKKNVQIILGLAATSILAILIMQKPLLELTSLIGSLKIGAIISTILLFFIPSMILGLISPIMIKLTIKDLSNAGKVSGRIYAIGTLGGIFGTFLGGFFLLPTLGNKTTLFLLVTTLLVLIFIIRDYKKKISQYAIISFLILIDVLGIILFNNLNQINADRVKNKEANAVVEYDTQYGKVDISNRYLGEDFVRIFQVDKGFQSVRYLDEDKKYELASEYTRAYDWMFKYKENISDVLMIGGAGYAYPKYYISQYQERNMDVIEIDERVTELAKEYFSLDELIDEYKIKENNRLKIYTEDGRTYLNKNEKKYDSILNDAFSGSTPAETLTTIEAVERIHDSLNENGLYLTNVVSSLEGGNSKFLYAEANTIKQVFKNVYVVPISTNDKEKVQNLMVIASDKELEVQDAYDIKFGENEIVITDNCCPVSNLIPIS